MKQQVKSSIESSSAPSEEDNGEAPHEQAEQSLSQKSEPSSGSRAAGGTAESSLNRKTNHDTIEKAASTPASTAQQRCAALYVFLGGASYGAMATTYKLAYTAGFSSNQVVAAQAWGGFVLFVAVCIVEVLRGNRLQRLPIGTVAKLVGTGALTGMTSILYCFAMSKLPVAVALTLLFQFTWIGIVIQVIVTRRAPSASQVGAAATILVGTVFASGIYQTGIAGYDPVALACGFGAAISCALFVTLSGMVPAPCSTAQRGATVCAGTVLMSLTVAPNFLSSGALVQGFAPYALVVGVFGLFLPVMLFGRGTPHLEPGISTILTSAELPAGLLVAMIVLGTPISAIEWLGVAAILSGVAIAQMGRKRTRKQYTSNHADAMKPGC